MVDITREKIVIDTMMAEANAWVRKYLIVLSEEYLLFFLISRGINESRLISSASHAINQELTEIEANEEVSRVVMKINVEG